MSSNHESTMAEQAQALAAKLKSRAQTQPAQITQQPARVSTDSSPCSMGAGCPVCGGIGWVRLNVPPGHPDWGRLQMCPNVKIWTLPDSAQYGLVASEIEHLSWDSILPLGHAKQAADKVREVLAQGSGWVYIYGNHGQAKSLILKIAIAESLRAGLLGAYANMADVISHIQRAFDTDNPNTEAERRLEFWTRLKLLALDEFDRFNQTRWATASQFRLMDERNVSAIRGESITLIASNQPPEALDPYYRSRIQDGRFTIIPLYSEDARPMMGPADRF